MKYTSHVMWADIRDSRTWKSFRTSVAPFPRVTWTPILGIGAADIQKLKSAGICTVYV